MNKYEMAIMLLESQRNREFIRQRIESYTLAIETLKEKQEREVADNA